MSRRALVAGLVIALFAPGIGSSVQAATLTDAALRAFAERAEKAQQAFMERTSRPAGGDPQLLKSVGGGAIAAEPGSGDGINDVDDALVHHWRARVLLPGVTIDQVLPLSRSYPDYPTIFRPIVQARILSQEGDHFKVQFRLKESAGGLSATLDVRSGITYSRPEPSRAYVISRSEQIHEVKDANRPGERLLPEGKDSGYLWRSATFTSFIEDRAGVWMEMETLGLSRQFPRMLGWIIERIEGDIVPAMSRRSRRATSATGSAA